MRNHPRATQRVAAGTIVLAAAGPTTLAQSDSLICLSEQTLTQVGDIGSVTDLFRDGDSLYVLDRAERELIRYDVRNPLSPELDGEWTTATTPHALHIDFPYAYIATDNNGLRILDISGTIFSYVSHTPTPGDAIDVHYADGIAYIADGAAGLTIADVSDPDNVQLLSTLSLPGSAAAIELMGTHALVACGSGGLRVVDISDPSQPAEVGSFTAPHAIGSLDVMGSAAYLGTGLHGVLYTVDLSDPSQPVQTAADEFESGWIYGITIDSGYLMVANGSLGLRVFDLHDPHHPEQIIMLPTYGSTHDAAIVSGHAFIAGAATGGLLRARLQSQARPPLIRGIPTDSNSISVLPVGDMLYVGDDAPSLNLYSIADPSSPQLVSTLPLAARPEEIIQLSAGTLVVAAENAGVRVIDVNDPNAPMVVSSIATPSAARSLDLLGTHLYVGCAQGVQVLDISNSAAPVLVGQSEGSSESIESLIAVDGNLFCAAGFGGLQVYDLTSPATPVLAGELALSFMFDYAQDITIRDGVAYLAATDSVSTIDISDPHNPSYLSNGMFNLSGGNLALQWPYLLVNTFKTELNVINIQDPQSPVWGGRTLTPGDGFNQEIAVHDGYAYMAKSSDGLLVYNAGENCEWCPADIDQDGDFSFFDVSRFISSYTAQSSEADLNFDGVWDFFDVSLYLGRIDDRCD